MDQCHWLFVLTFIQIFTMMFVTVLSAILLSFLLNVVFEQTSDLTNEFKDAIAILPTIILNLWLIYKNGDWFKATKNIADEVSDPLSLAEQGQAHS